MAMLENKHAEKDNSQRKCWKQWNMGFKSA